jgi:MPBQ/MSBQ methyltransferase
LRPGGVGVVVGPVQPAGRAARALADAWMLFPTVEQYQGWFTAAGFTDVEVHAVAPPWYRDRRGPYAVAVAGVKPRPGPSPLPLSPAPAETLEHPLDLRGRLRVSARFLAGSAAGAAWVPIAAALALRARLTQRDGG